MGKILSYEDFAKIAKVGMKVREVPDKYNPCNKLRSNAIGTITEALPGTFEVNGCIHAASTDCYLELLESTLETLQVGDTVLDEDGYERIVRAVIADAIAISHPFGDQGMSWFTVQDLKDFGFKVKDADPELKELTLADVAKLAGVPVEQLRIKEEA